MHKVIFFTYLKSTLKELSVLVNTSRFAAAVVISSSEKLLNRQKFSKDLTFSITIMDIPNVCLVLLCPFLKYRFTLVSDQGEVSLPRYLFMIKFAKM